MPRGRHKLPYKTRGATLSFSEEAWVMLNLQADAAGLNRSHYVEMLVRRGQNNYLDELQKFLLIELAALETSRLQIDSQIERYRELLYKLGYRTKEETQQDRQEGVSERED